MYLTTVRFDMRGMQLGRIGMWSSIGGLDVGDCEDDGDSGVVVSLAAVDVDDVEADDADVGVGVCAVAVVGATHLNNV